MHIQRRNLALYIFLLPLALLSFWQVFESDLFYLIRTGQEMIQNKAFINTELWSFTAQGQPWLNHQWLSEILFSLAESLLGIETFPGLRVILTIAILLFSAKIVLRNQISFSESLCAILFVFTVLYPRIQLRSELLVFALFAVQVFKSQGSGSQQRFLVLHSLIVCTWAQLHGGTAWISGLYALCHLQDRFHPRSFSERFLSLIPLLMILVSPLGPNIIKVLLEHTQLGGNPELTGVHWSDLNPLQEGLTYSAPFIAAAFFLRPRLRPLTWVKMLLCLLLVLGLFRARVLPYFAIGLLPLWKPQGLPAKVNKALAVALLISVTSVSLLDPRHLAWGLDPDRVPVKVSEFLTQSGLQGPMLNHYNFGAYLLWAQPQRQVAWDGRETPFKSFEKEMSMASLHPTTWRSFLDKYQISFVVEARPDETEAEKYQLLFPKKDWAAIYADELAVVLVRRNVQHQSLIDRLEIPF